MSDTPRVSILIPNYNNGTQSSRNKIDNLILELLESLRNTLSEETTPFEMIAYDDGSTDDSLQTLRDWSKMTWPNGQPMLRLIEDEHCGVLARTANIMSREARGDILARLDGDIVCLTKNWVSKLTEMFDSYGPDVGVIGPKQLKPNMGIHSFGDFILHPKGYCHVACGYPRNSVKYRVEVDHVMGCFYCCRKSVFDALGGYDEDFLRGQTIDFGMRSRLAGYRCFAVPEIEFIHQHTKRENRSTTADSQEGVEKTLETFEKKWGFNRLSPDLVKVKQMYAGTPLLWNELVFGEAAKKTAPAPVPTTLQASQWMRYTNDAAVQSRVNLRQKVTSDIIKQSHRPNRIAILGAGEGLLAHLFAAQGLAVVAVDEREPMIGFARQCIAGQQYKAGRPQFLFQSDASRIPLETGSVDYVIIDDMLERHSNPTALLNEAWRIASPDSFLAVVSQRLRATTEDDPSSPEQFAADMTVNRRYVWIELINQIQAVGGWEIAIDIKSDDPNRDMVAIARRIDKPERAQPEQLRDAKVA